MSQIVLAYTAKRHIHLMLDSRGMAKWPDKEAKTLPESHAGASSGASCVACCHSSKSATITKIPAAIRASNNRYETRRAVSVFAGDRVETV